MQVKLLNVGCGYRYHEAWTNLDVVASGPGVIVHDLNKPLPFPDASFDVVYHSHVLEHFEKEQAFPFMRECNRVLRHEGVIRVVVPDLEQIVSEYVANLRGALDGDEDAKKKYEWIMIELFDQMVRNRPGGAMREYWKQDPMPAEEYVVKRLGSEVSNYLSSVRRRQGSLDRSSRLRLKNLGNIFFGSESVLAMIAQEVFGQMLRALRIGKFRISGEIHQWMYDRYSLYCILTSAGFSEVEPCTARESRIPEFNTYLLDVEADGRVRKPDSLFMEGRKV